MSSNKNLSTFEVVLINTDGEDMMTKIIASIGQSAVAKRAAKLYPAYDILDIINQPSQLTRKQSNDRQLLNIKNTDEDMYNIIIALL